MKKVKNKKPLNTEKKKEKIQVYDMGEVNGVRLTYVNGNVYATPIKKKKL